MRYLLRHGPILDRGTPESSPADPRWYATAPGRTNLKSAANQLRLGYWVSASSASSAQSKQVKRSGHKACEHRAYAWSDPIVPRRTIPRRITEGSPSRQSPRTLLPMWSQREVIDYALQRRSTLQALRRPGRTLARQEACDADPMLIRAAKHHGEPSNVNCPVCESEDLVNLHYVFGDQLGQYSGRIKRTTELEEMAHEFGEFKVVVVEVCPACGWNHMILSYLLGDGVKRKPPRRQQTVEDIYG